MMPTSSALSRPRKSSPAIRLAPRSSVCCLALRLRPLSFAACRWRCSTSWRKGQFCERAAHHCALYLFWLSPHASAETDLWRVHPAALCWPRAARPIQRPDEPETGWPQFATASSVSSERCITTRNCKY